jgi:hypothetical protein
VNHRLVAACVVAICAGAWASAEDPPPPQPTPTPAPAAPAQTPSYFNPAISVIGNFLAAGGSNRIENLPAASLRESELSLQAVVDPYGRADFFFSVGEHGVDVEEGYLTFTSLPWQLLAKVGRMRVAFGKVNTMHLHVMPWPDEPLPVVNLLGGEEGWIGDGVSVAKLLSLPGDLFSELTVQVLDGNASELFHAEQRSDLAYDAHYRVFADLSDAANLDAGASWGLGPNGTGGGATTTLEGVDVTLRWKPLQQGTYRSAVLRGELYRSRRDQPGGTETATGWYLSGDYQLARRWWVGVRGEAAEHAADPGVKDTGLAATVTFNPSEFSQLRAELRRRCYGGPNQLGPDTYTANEVLLQLQFAIGAHGAHPF